MKGVRAWTDSIAVVENIEPSAQVAQNCPSNRRVDAFHLVVSPTTIPMDSFRDGCY
jgi:hypothetical protein